MYVKLIKTFFQNIKISFLHHDSHGQHVFNLLGFIKILIETIKYNLIQW